MVSCALPSAQLELVPDLEQPVMNPIVSKALERLERARRPDQIVTGFAAAATAPAFEPVADIIAEPEVSDPKTVETKPKLTVVAPSKPKTEPTDRKRVRVISDRVEDVALSYLETCLSVPAIAADPSHESAGFGRRAIAGSLDLLLVALMAAPVAAAIEFSDGDWSEPASDWLDERHYDRHDVCLFDDLNRPDRQDFGDAHPFAANHRHADGLDSDRRPIDQARSRLHLRPGRAWSGNPLRVSRSRSSHYL